MSPLLLPLLGAVAYFDLRHLRIPDFLSITAIGLFLVIVPSLSVGEIGTRLIVAVVAFIACFAAFSANMLGGGDAKFLPALLLSVPPQDVSAFCLTMALALPVSIGAVIGARRLAGPGGRKWASITGGREVPVGVSIAIAGLATYVIGL